METNVSIKNTVREKYAHIANQSKGCGCSCSGGCCGDTAVDYSMIGDDYAHIDGYVQVADLGLGCGVPTEYAGINEGDTVVDLGSGAGNDAFIARHLVGENGRVIGVDMTPDMVTTAIENGAKLGFQNVEFRLGEIEDVPLDNDSTDVVLSNCVLNLVPNKEQAFAEIYRILKPGGHFCISDTVLQGELPENVKRDAELYAGCVSGAIQEADYLNIIKQTGFQDVEVKVKKETPIPDDVLRESLSEADIANLRALTIGVFSITVVGKKM